MNELTSDAERWAIEPGYRDVFGRWHATSEEALVRLVAALSAGRTTPASVDAPPPLGHLRAWQGDGHRHWALAGQLYALRSHRNWGIGDFTDLAGLISLAAAVGASGIGLNPLHALFPDQIGYASPYTPNSRVFLNVLYIDVEAIEEFPGLAAAGLQQAVATLRETDLIDYPSVARAKLAGLRLAWTSFCENASPQRRQEFESYRNECGEGLLRFACFEVLRQWFAPTPWPDWPAPWRRPERTALEQFRADNRDAVEFQEFMQWVAHRQLLSCQDAARALGMPIGLYLDFAVGIDPHGADAWAMQDIVLDTVSVGAPPDEFNTAGQDWGLAPLNPHRLADNDFSAFRRFLAAAMRYAGAVRIDHVLGLKRVYMIPHGMSPTEGAYVRCPFEPLLRVVAEESNRHKCIVIGEDLGTVPEGFRDTLAHWGLWSYRVMLFERESDGRFCVPEQYPAQALATFTTHDLPSFQGWLSGHDLRTKRAIGVDPGESDDARARAQQWLRAILQERASRYSPEDMAAVAAFLAATPSRLVAVALEDILGEVNQVNIPGTTHQHPNWRRKLSLPLEELGGHEGFRRVAEAFAQAGRAIQASLSKPSGAGA